MRIVAILPTFKDETAYNYRINIGFINKLSSLCEYYDVKAYNKDSLVYSAKEVYEKYKPDAILLLAHSDVLNGYLKGLPCLKVMIAVDFFKVIQRNKFYWYKNNGFDLVIQRHPYESYESMLGIPCRWIPYCADERVFYPADKWTVNSQVGFVGSVNEGYEQRYKAIQLLRDILHNGGSRLIGDDYTSFLRNHMCMLTSTQMHYTKVNTAYAKAFEIIASGSVLLSPPMDRPIITNYVAYKPDCSDIVEKAKWIMNNEEECRDIAKKAYVEFKEKHTDSIRIRELYKVIEEYII